MKVMNGLHSVLLLLFGRGPYAALRVERRRARKSADCDMTLALDRRASSAEPQMLDAQAMTIDSHWVKL